MLDVKSMSGEELRENIYLFAVLLGQRRYQRLHPGCDEDTATAWAVRHWTMFREKSLDLLAGMAVQQEVAEECGRN